MRKARCSVLSLLLLLINGAMFDANDEVRDGAAGVDAFDDGNAVCDNLL